MLLKLLRWWWLALLPTLVVSGYVLVTYHAPAVSYATTLKFTAGQPATLAETPGYDPNYYRWLTSEYIVSGLKDWVVTGQFAAAVQADLTANGQPVQGGIAAADNARSILVIYLAGPDAASVEHLAAAVTNVLQTQNAAVFPQLGGQVAVVTPLDAVVVVTPSAPGLRERFDPLIKIALGLMVGIGFAFAAHYFDPFVRDKRDLEQLGLPIVGEIPKGRR